jgi:hypothetical protein
VTIRTALARLKRRQKDLQESHAIYKELLDSQDLFPKCRQRSRKLKQKCFRKPGTDQGFELSRRGGLLLGIDLTGSEMNAKKTAIAFPSLFRAKRA